jgi:hypothetical protein
MFDNDSTRLLMLPASDNARLSHSDCPGIFTYRIKRSTVVSRLHAVCFVS